MSSDTREGIMELLREQPGCCLQDIADHLGIARTSVVHHVRVLRRQKQIVVQRKGRRALHFPTAVGDRVHRTILAAWRLDTARAILEHLVDDPCAPWRAIARSLGVTPRAVRWHLQRMQKDGLLRIQRTPDGGHEAILHPQVLQLSKDPDAEMSWPPGR